jgi:hypothetical protein
MPPGFRLAPRSQEITLHAANRHGGREIFTLRACAKLAAPARPLETRQTDAMVQRRFVLVAMTRKSSRSTAVSLQKSGGEKGLQNRRQIFGDILGDEARPKMPGRRTMQPDGGGGRFKQWHGLGK